MAKYKLTNLSTPYISKLFKVSDLDDIKIVDLKKEDNTDGLMTVLSIPSEISERLIRNTD